MFTRGKWIAVQNKDGSWDVEFRDELGGGMIATMDNCMSNPGENARRIVTAVNSHDGLVEALRDLVCDYTCQVPKEQHNAKTREKVRQALAQAKE